MKIFITGSTDGLGKLAAQTLIGKGHNVVLHARNQHRLEDIRAEFPETTEIVVSDLSNIVDTKHLADELNDMGTFDAVIHNAGVYNTSKSRILTVNCLSPYVLTFNMNRPKRLIYISSGLHQGSRANIHHIAQGISYSDSKLYILMLSKAVASGWKDVYSNAVNPGWVPTKMGGSGAPDDLQKGYETQVWLAVSKDKEALVSGKYFFHRQPRGYNPLADDSDLQTQFLDQCERLTGVGYQL